MAGISKSHSGRHGGLGLDGHDTPVGGLKYEIGHAVQAGFDHFIDLTEADERLEPYADIAAQEAGRLSVKFVHERCPIVDVSVPRSPQETAGILDAIDRALDDGSTVYLHCWGGVGRTGTVVGCWLVRHGMTGDEALLQIAEWWRGMEKVYRMPRSPATRQQRAYVRNWVEPSRRGAPC